MNHWTTAEKGAWMGTYRNMNTIGFGPQVEAQVELAASVHESELVAFRAGPDFLRWMVNIAHEVSYDCVELPPLEEPHMTEATYREVLARNEAEIRKGGGPEADAAFKVFQLSTYRIHQLVSGVKQTAMDAAEDELFRMAMGVPRSSDRIQQLTRQSMRKLCGELFHELAAF